MADREREIKKILARDPDYAKDTDITKRATREEGTPPRTAPTEVDHIQRSSLLRDVMKDMTPRELKVFRMQFGLGGSGGSDTKEMQLGSELDPKAMMKRSGMKKGGAVRSASSRADGIAQRGKTRGRMV